MSGVLFSERKLNRGLFGLGGERPRAAQGTALVLTGGDGPVVLWPGERTTPGDRVWGGYDTVYTVDLGLKPLKFSDTVPASGGDVNFTVTLEADYQVSDPGQLVNQRIQDAEGMLRRVLTETVSRITAGFDIEDGPAALAAVRKAIEDGKLSVKLPFTLKTFKVALDLDAQAKQFLSQKRDQRRKTELADHSNTLTEATGKADQLKQEYDLKLKRQQKEHELDIARRQVEMELEIQQMRMEVYRPMIEGGLWPMLVQRLAQNPQDIDQVTGVIMQMHAQKTDSDVRMLQTLINGDLIENRQLKEVASNLVQSIEHNLRGGPLRLEGKQPKQLPDGGSSDAAGDKE